MEGGNKGAPDQAQGPPGMLPPRTSRPEAAGSHKGGHANETSRGAASPGNGPASNGTNDTHTASRAAAAARQAGQVRDAGWAFLVMVISWAGGEGPLSTNVSARIRLRSPARWPCWPPIAAPDRGSS